MTKQKYVPKAETKPAVEETKSDSVQQPEADVKPEGSSEQGQEKDSDGTGSETAGDQNGTDEKAPVDPELEEAAKLAAQAELDAAAQEVEAARVAEEQAAAVAEAEAKLAEEAAQQKEEEAAAAALKLEQEQSGDLQPPADSPFVKKESAMVATLKSIIDNYVAVMGPTRAVSEDTINSQQTALFNLYNSWMNKLSDAADFLQVGEHILKTIAANRDGAFAPNMANRGQMYIRLPAGRRRALAAVNNVLYSVTHKDRAFGYKSAGDVRNQLLLITDDQGAQRASEYIRRFCGIDR